MFLPKWKEEWMLTKRELLWLHALQADFVRMRDWVAVDHVQGLIDHIADEHGLAGDPLPKIGTGLEMH